MVNRLNLESRQFDTIRDLLAAYSGIYLDRTNQRSLLTGLAQRLTATGLALEAYIAYLGGPGRQTELQHLAELIANHETVFFRNMLHMRALQEDILPGLNRRKAIYEPLRIWSAGCSTGEEPYSLAITALESLGTPLPRPVNIWATDLSDAALERARAGVYRGRAFTNVTTETRPRYFEPRLNDEWAIRDKVRSIVTFERLNLLEPFPPQAQGVDIIFCQNVTIYFQLATFRDLVERFYAVLPEGGLLFLGFSETLWNVFDKLRLREIMGAFVYIKEPVSKPALPEARASSQTVAPAGSLAAGKASAQRNGPEATTRDRSPASSYDAANARLPTGELRSLTTQNAATVQLPIQSSSDAIQQGRALLDQGRADEALAMLYQLPLNGPHAPQVLALIAQGHANRGDFELAVVEARRAVELNPLTIEAYLLLGMLHLQQGQVQEATGQFERARYLDPDSGLISYHLAESYRQSQRSDAALREYRNALRKLTRYAPDMILDGVVVSWLRETCERHIQTLERGRK